MAPMILASMFYVQRNENGSLGRKRRYLRASSVKTAIKNIGIKCVSKLLGTYACPVTSTILIPLF